MKIDGPASHRFARAWTASGLRASGTLWKYVERAAPLPEHATLSVGGYSVDLDLAADIVDVPLYKGAYEEAEQSIAHRMLKRGSLFVDVGANHGLYTALALSVGARVVAVEPHPGLAAYLRQQFPAVTVHEVAVADEAGHATLHVFPNSTYMSTIRSTGIRGSAPVEVAALRLDELLADIGPIDLLKVDVEQMEAAVLTGAERLFRDQAVRAALVEILVDHDRIEDMLSSWGYKGRLVNRSGRILRRARITETAISSGVGGNYLITHK